ncbi:NADPH-dependent F420 reductase [Streptomyces melanogenes]|uniref:NAD(P)-binding domain-containing protein n=1 Tax=Streptomyces melanogenes TaxID=67326 RepID=A0ABZ1XM06_9ACTN|nr:NAD(P)-binding domain-containing protein [Streptomyces melanogenes]
MSVGVIGAGPMGRAAARQFALAGETVRLADRSPELAVRAAAAASAGTRGSVEAHDVAGVLEAELITLAMGTDETLAFVIHHRSALAGKILIDTTNPVEEGGGSALGRTGPSMTELIARAAPQSSVVKAFNTACAATLFAGRVDGAHLDVFVAGDDYSAKIPVIELIDRAGLRGLDAGDLRNAHVLEQMALLCMELIERLGLGLGAGIKLLPDG